MILRYLTGRDWLMLCACILLIAGQVYLDLRIPEYMSEITDHLQMGTATEIIVRDGERMLVCAFASLAMALGTAVLAARVSASLCSRLRSLLFESVGSFARQDIDGFSAASLITRSTNDVYQVQQFLPRAINMVVKAPLIAVLAVWKISGSAYEWTAATVVAMLVLVSGFSLLLYRGMPFIRRMQTYVDAVNRITREGLEGTKGIRAYNAESRQEARLEGASDHLLDNSMSVVRTMSPMHALSSSMLNFLTLAIYWLGAGIIQSAGSQGMQMQLFSSRSHCRRHGTDLQNRNHHERKRKMLRIQKRTGNKRRKRLTNIHAAVRKAVNAAETARSKKALARPSNEHVA